MTALAVDSLAPAPKPEPPRDRWGRYMIPDAKGKPVAHTRATTVAKTLADTYALEQWQMRQVAAGLARRQDLIGMAASHDPDTDRKVFEEIVEGALEASESAAGRRAGTTLHRFTEQHDLGTVKLDQIPDPYRARVEQYRDKLAADGVQVHPEWVEQIFTLDAYTIAGTADRIVTLADGRRVIADLKTGKSVDFGALEFAIQLAIYANHDATFDQAANRRGKPVPDVDRATGLIIHLPAQGDGCHLYTVDLVQGYDALITAMEVREWRKTKGLLQPYRVLNGGTGGASALRDWLRERIRVAAGHSDAALADLGARWPSTVPQPLPAELLAHQIEDLATCLDRVEAAHQIPFGAVRPGTVPPTKSTTKRATK